MSLRNYKAHLLIQQLSSDARVVVLRDIALGSAGVYTCEASSEAPRFRTVSGQGEMRVIDLPDSRPVLTGHKNRGYRVGEWMDVNCSSPNSKPPAALKWYINNEMVRHFIQGKAKELRTFKIKE